MKIKLTGGIAASDEEVLALEAALGCRISDSFKDFLRVHDGAKPENNYFEIGSNNDSRVNRFIPANKIIEERQYLENIPGAAYPVAWAEGGNYVFVDESRNGAVFFWDHEIPEEPTQLAPSFDAFLDLLDPNVPKVELQPGQVKRVWVDPEFLKRIKKQKQ